MLVHIHVCWISVQPLQSSEESTSEMPWYTSHVHVPEVIFNSPKNMLLLYVAWKPFVPMFVWHLIFIIDKHLCRHGLQGFYSWELNYSHDWLTVLFLQINNAYSVLSDATQRLEYDLKLKEMPITQPSEGSPFGSVRQHRWEAVVFIKLVQPWSFGEAFGSVLYIFLFQGSGKPQFLACPFWQVALKFSFPRENVKCLLFFYNFSWQMNCLGPLNIPQATCKWEWKVIYRILYHVSN